MLQLPAPVPACAARLQMAGHPERVANASQQDQVLMFVASLYFSGRVGLDEQESMGMAPATHTTVNGVTVTHLLRAAKTDMVRYTCAYIRRSAHFCMRECASNFGSFVGRVLPFLCPALI